MLKIVLKLDEEDAIVTIYETNFRLESRSPKVRLVRPVACPLARAPGVTQLHKAYILTLVLELMDRDERVSMA